MLLYCRKNGLSNVNHIKNSLFYIFYLITLITCPQCHQIRKYYRMCNFNVYICDCEYEFYCNAGNQNEEYLIEKNPFQECIIRQHYDLVV